MVPSRPSSDGFSKYFFVTGAVLFTGLILKSASSLFVPLGYAFFLSIVMYPICSYLEKKGIGRQSAISLALIFMLLMLSALLFLFGMQLQKIASEWPMIHERLSELLLAIRSWLSERFGISNEEITRWLLDTINSSLGTSVNLLGTTLQSLVVNLAILALIPVYTYLILYYRSRLAELLLVLLPGHDRTKVIEVLRLSVAAYFRFIRGMAVVYALVGTLNALGLWLMGVPNAFLFGYLTAIMTFIPYVGIIVASILPITYAWTTYGIIWYPLGVVALFAFVQYLEANIIFPWAVGRRLELNTLATLIVIVAGGIIWGASGMILFIPFAAILKLIADRLPGWEAVSMFLGNGSLTGEKQNY
ncbi:MAG: AI-2E family transporter [Bacteroidia bacterium]